MKTVICTTGTSIARNCGSLKAYQQRATSWDDPTPDLDKEIAARLSGMDLTKEADRVEVSAEVHSLHRLGLSSGDRVVLLATDTADGRVCAQAIARAIRIAFGLDEEQIALHRIEGLQVRDAVRLRDVGLVRFTDAVISCVENPQYRHGSELILNPTGGFKGVVPFLAVIGMIFRLKTVYVFESSSALIVLPPLPLTFDLHLYERAAAALQHIYKNSYVNEAEFFSRIADYQPHERDLFMGFVESAEGQMMTLSPLAFVLVRIGEEGCRELYLSKSARNALESSQGLKRLALERLLLRLADPVWRSVHIHSVTGTDLEVYKPGSTAERAFCVTRGDRVNVCELIPDHDDYERMLQACHRADYNLERFEPWTPNLELSDIEAEYRKGMEEEIERLRRELNECLAHKGKAIGEARKDSRAEVARLRDQVAIERREKEQLRCEKTNLAGLLREAEAQIDDLRKKMAEYEESSHDLE